MSGLSRPRQLAILLFAALGSPPAAEAQRPRAPAISPLAVALATPTDDLRRAVTTFLGDTLLENRTAGSRGGLIAARYLASQFQSLGLRPGAPDGSYYQPVPLIAIESNASIVFGAGRETFAPRTPQEVVLRAETTDPQVSLDGELVFAGFGIEAPEHGWDDYKGVPQTGRIVMVLGGDPQRRDSSLAGGTRYGEVSHKIATAAKAGAAGVIVVSAASNDSWSQLASGATGEVVRIQPASAPRVRFVAWIREPVARRLLQAANRDYDLLFRRAQQKDFSPLTTGINASIGIESRVERRTGMNVIARLAGSDSATGQGVVVAAPYTGPAGASSAATLMAVAASASRFGAPVNRALLFIATAGGAGAEHYVSAPAVTVRRTAAVLFIGDAAADTTVIHGRGAARSTLGEIMRAAAQADTVEFIPTTETDGAVTRSEAAAFFQAGRPTVVVPPDQRGRVARLVVRTAWALAGSPGFPQWHPEFEPK